MSVRPLFAAACAAAMFAVAPAAEACDQCGYDPCPCAAPVVAYDPCCEPPVPTLRERIAAKRLARLERRQDRIRGRFADDCCPPYGVAPAHASYGGYGSSYGYSSYSSYGYGGGYGYGGYGY